MPLDFSFLSVQKSSDLAGADSVVGAFVVGKDVGSLLWITMWWLTIQASF